jgi:hypothetical protein
MRLASICGNLEAHKGSVVEFNFLVILGNWPVAFNVVLNYDFVICTAGSGWFVRSVVEGCEQWMRWWSSMPEASSRWYLLPRTTTLTLYLLRANLETEWRYRFLGEGVAEGALSSVSHERARGQVGGPIIELLSALVLLGEADILVRERLTVDIGELRERECRTRPQQGRSAKEGEGVQAPGGGETL